MTSGFKERVWHATLYVVGALVLLAAVAVTGVRLALPGIGQYKNAVQAWAEDYMDYPLSVDSISAEWQGWIPSLLLNGVRLHGRGGGPDLISFDFASVEISPLRSLWKRSPEPRRIVISGLDLQVLRQADGALLVQGIHINPEQRGQDNEFVKWLFSQDSIEVQDTNITWTDRQHRQDVIRFTAVNLLIQTDQARSQMAGAMKLPGKYGEKLSFALDATGELWSSDWSGQLYVAATRFKPDSWYRTYRPRQLTPAGGSADLELWSAWEQARPVRVQGRLNYRDFVVLTSDRTLNVNALTTRFSSRKLPDQDWHIALKLDRLETENGVWPTTSIELVMPGKPVRRYALNFDYLNLADLAPLARDFEFIPADARRLLDTATLRSELLDGLIIYAQGADAEPALVYDLAFRNLYVALGPDQPLAEISSGRLRGADARGNITLNGASAGFVVPELFSNTLRFDKLEGALSWSHTAAGWTLQTDALALENQDLSLALRGSAQHHEESPSPYLNLVAEIRSERLENIYRYMPRTDKFRIRDWMQRSLHAGHVETAVAVLRGYPHEFPFRDNNGSLRGVVNLSRSIVEYSQQWPAVDDVEARLFFHNELLTAHIERGSVFDAQVTGAKGSIEDLTRRPKVVLLKGRVKGPEKDLETFIEQSPLAEDQIISYANQALAAGDFDMELDMAIPIKAPQLQTVLNGSLRLEDARLVSEPGNLQLEQVRGTVGFTRDSVDGRRLRARLDGKPVTLTMRGSKNTPEAPPVFEISGRSTHTGIMQQISERFPGAAHFASRLGERSAGFADWQARFIFAQDAQGLSQRLEIESDLYGLALDLPRPLGKPTYARKTLLISKTLGKPGPTELVYDDNVFARLYTGQNNSLERLDIALGDGFRGGAAGPGVNLTGRTDILLLDDWRAAIAFFTPEEDGAAGFFSSANINLELETRLLRALNQQFTHSAMQASRRNGDWRIAMQGAELEGEARFPRLPSPQNRVELNLDKLVISKTGNTGAAGAVNPRQLPPIRAEIADFTYGDYRLGSMRLAATPALDGLAFEDIGFATPDMTITGGGLWNQPSNLSSQSVFNINVEADKLHKLLATFGYDDTAIKAGKTKIAIDAGWDGAPDEFSLEKLVGTFDIRVKKGQLLEVSPAAGRLFGLLSVQSLPRRLTLDFTDLFGKGLAFDRITGSFNIADGNAYTNDLRLAGPSVDMSISGRTGLTEQDYDQLVTVTPRIADNLPVAGALLGPVGIGVGAVLYLAGNMFENINDNINRMLSHQYTITGNWHDPQIKKLKAALPEEQRGQTSEVSESPGPLAPAQP